MRTKKDRVDAAAGNHTTCRAQELPLCEVADSCNSQLALDEEDLTMKESAVGGTQSLIANEWCGNDDSMQLGFRSTARTNAAIYLGLEADADRARATRDQRRTLCGGYDRSSQEKRESCNVEQRTFELESCQLATQITQIRTEVDKAFNDAATAYNIAKTATLAEEEIRKNEFKTLSQTQCLLQRIHETSEMPCDPDETGTEVNETQVNEQVQNCHNMFVNTSILNINYNEVGAVPELPDTPSTPCSDGFTSAHYGAPIRSLRTCGGPEVCSPCEGSDEAEDLGVEVDGIVSDAMEGSNLEGATVSVRLQSTIHSTTTDSNGHWSMTVPQGRLNFAVSRQGFSPLDVDLDIQPSLIEEGYADFALTSIAANRYSAVLTWGKESHDLDAHITMYKGNSQPVFGANHVFWRSRQVPSNARTEESCTPFGCRAPDFHIKLDRDDTRSYGPETMTWNNVNRARDSFDAPYIYVYRVWDFCALPEGLSASAAKVRVEGFDSEEQRTYFHEFNLTHHGIQEQQCVADCAGTSPMWRNKWNVFKLTVSPCPRHNRDCVPSVEIEDCRDSHDTCPADFSDCMVDDTCSPGMPDNWMHSNGQQPGRPNFGRCSGHDKD